MSDSDDSIEASILDDPAYKASMKKLDEAIRAHHRLVEDWGNAHDSGGSGEDEASVVTGWILTIGQLGYQGGREYHNALLEMPDYMNTFTALGLANWSVRFMENETAPEYYGD